MQIQGLSLGFFVRVDHEFRGDRGRVCEMGGCQPLLASVTSTLQAVYHRAHRCPDGVVLHQKHFLGGAGVAFSNRKVSCGFMARPQVSNQDVWCCGGSEAGFVLEVPETGHGELHDNS